MKIVKRIETLDGKLFDDEKIAWNHADKCYGDALHKISVELKELNYTQIMDYIDKNILEFIKIKKLKDDLNFISQNMEELDE